MTVSISESTNFAARRSAPAHQRLDRAAIEAAIRAYLFLGRYGDVPAVNGVAVAADAIWNMHCADLALERRLP